jgi:hypothetical protein
MKNIRDNEAYGNVEFVVLDYNSQDGLEDWIRAEGRQYLNSGDLKFFRNPEPQVFKRSHSRNMCFRLATGDIICNVDADNFIGKDFSLYVNNVFNTEKNIFLSGEGSKRDTIGRFCILKDDFINIKGYNEAFAGYGFEDLELYKRLMIHGKTQINIPAFRFLSAIHHEHQERVSNEELAKDLRHIFVSYRTPNESDLIFVYGTRAIRASLLNYTTPFYREYDQIIQTKGLILLREPLQESLENGGYRRFYFELSARSISKKLVVMLDGNNKLIDCEGEELFYEIVDQRLIQHLILLVSEVANKNTMHHYLRFPAKVNQHGFGKGVVYTSQGLCQCLN